MPEPDDAVEFAAMFIEMSLTEPLATTAVCVVEIIVSSVTIRLEALATQPGICLALQGFGSWHARHIVSATYQ
ncbi:hypothetical protein CQ054_06700 [Ochrobactrum sp. MYb29]|nr:hypothetical protein CQ054_06700 [Ochrobactrum sp. MYb29]